MKKQQLVWALLGIVTIGSIILLVCGIDGEVKGILGIITGAAIKTVFDNKGGNK